MDSTSGDQVAIAVTGVSLCLYERLLTVIMDGSATVVLCSLKLNGRHSLSSKSLNQVGGLMSLVRVLSS